MTAWRPTPALVRASLIALVGLGVRQLSVGARSVPLVKRIVRGISVAVAEAAAEAAVGFGGGGAAAAEGVQAATGAGGTAFGSGAIIDITSVTSVAGRNLA